MSRANPTRGEASIRVGDADVLLRPSFQALVAAEEELGPLFALVERAAAGQLKLAELATLFHHLSKPPVPREQMGNAIVAGGLAGATPALKIVLGEILQGR